VVIKEIRKREAEGKGSHVYLNGRKLDPGRVMREIRRYSGNGNTEELVEKDTSIGVPPSILKFNLEIAAHNLPDIAIDSHTPSRIEIRTPSPSKVQPPLVNGSAIRHILPENMSTQQHHVAGPQTELTDSQLFFDPGHDLDAMDLDINTARVDEQAFCFSVTDVTSTMLDMSGVPPSHSQQILPLHCRYFPNPKDSTYLDSSPIFRNFIGWQEASSSFFYNSPGRRPFLEDKQPIDSLAIQKSSLSFLTLALTVAFGGIARSVFWNWLKSKQEYHPGSMGGFYGI
jgi:hypothetical protein